MQSCLPTERLPLQRRAAEALEEASSLRLRTSSFTGLCTRTVVLEATLEAAEEAAVASCSS